MNKTLKRWLPDVVAVVLFAVLAFAYFYPADTEGRILYQHDTSAGVGAGQEAKEYLERTGERTRWTNSLFGGMPTYQLAPSYSSTAVLSAAEKAYHLWLPDNVWYIFAYLLGFYILLRALFAPVKAPVFKSDADEAADRMKQSAIAILGAVMWAFSTYFLIIIGAGHLWKVMALAYLPPMIAGVLIAYQGRYIPALIVTAIFAALEIHANHMQMTYYYMFIILFMVVAYLVEAIREKRMAQWLKATGVCIVGGLLGVLVNISNIYHTWEYSQQTMRGGTELTKGDGQTSTDGGLDREYITQWSYGIDETWTLLIPNAKGGASGLLANNEDLMKEYANGQAVSFFSEVFRTNPYQMFSSYWGTQPFTAGPVYVGAFVLTLFILGLFLVRGPVKWALLAVTLLAIMLSWGKNFMGLTDFFIDHVPLYAKFRTVSSILVIAEFTIPLLAIIAMKKVIDDPAILSRKIKYVYASFALTGGLALLFALMPNVFFDLTSTDAESIGRLNSQVSGALSQYPDMMSQYQGVTAGLAESLHRMRTSVFTADCWRSFIIITIGMLLLLLYKARKLKALPTVTLITVLCLVDLWQVNKRYLNDKMFVDASIKQTAHVMKPVNQKILEDKTLDYRVLNFASDTFNENETSYYHKSVGGYHAAKLGRYNELIAAYIGPEMQNTIEVLKQSRMPLDSIPGDSIFPVINMLNTKYFIVSDNDALTNPFAQGNAWFVDKLTYVADANAELGGLAQADLRHEAVADKKFEQVLGQPAAADSAAAIKLNSYEPNELKYTVDSKTGGVLVFSEIYYPGWTATVDGKEASLGRVNYVLRAMRVEPGHHDIVLTFHPQTVKNTETIAYIAMAILVVLILAVVALRLKKRKAGIEKQR